MVTCPTLPGAGWGAEVRWTWRLCAQLCITVVSTILVISARLEVHSFSLGLIRPGSFCISKLKSILYFLIFLKVIPKSYHQVTSRIYQTVHMYHKQASRRCRWSYYSKHLFSPVCCFSLQSSIFFLSKYTRRSKCLICSPKSVIWNSKRKQSTPPQKHPHPSTPP